MARVTIDDRWLREDADGVPPSRAAKASLANAKDPLKANVPEKWRTTVYGRGKRWRCRWHVVVDGRRVQRSKAFDKYREAEEYASAMEDDIRRGRYHDPHQELRLFRDVADEWLRSKLNVKRSTYGRYERELRAYVFPKWGDCTLREMQRDVLQDWVQELVDGTYPANLLSQQGGVREPRPLKPRSIRSVVRIVTGGVLAHAVAEGYLSTNPMLRVVTPKIVDSDDDKVYLGINEIELLADEAGKVAADDMDATLVRFLAYTGVRVNEALALQVRDVDWAHGRVRIRHAWENDGTNGQRLGLPKNNEARWVAVPGSVMDALGRLCSDRQDGDWVFRAKHDGHIWMPNWRSRVWARAVRNAGMEGEGVTIHSLRHTYASLAIAAGADVKTLQKQLGHATATITLDTYAALWPERLGEVASAVDAAREAALVAQV